MSSYKQVQVIKQPKPGQVVTDSSLYWKDYEVCFGFIPINFYLFFFHSKL